MADEITYRTYNPDEIQVRYACPFCMRVATPTSKELEEHITFCVFYSALADNQPNSPPSAIIIDPDVPYTLEEYLEDETLYFESMISVAKSWPPIDQPADLVGAEEYFAAVISARENTLTPKRKKNIITRLITTFYKLPEHIMQELMMSMYDIDVSEELDI
jgi:hypothetical protein